MSSIGSFPVTKVPMKDFSEMESFVVTNNTKIGLCGTVQIQESKKLPSVAVHAMITNGTTLDQFVIGIRYSI